MKPKRLSLEPVVVNVRPGESGVPNDGPLLALAVTVLGGQGPHILWDIRAQPAPINSY